jgi:hypothetical protein
MFAIRACASETEPYWFELVKIVLDFVEKNGLYPIFLTLISLFTLVIAILALRVALKAINKKL